MDKIKKKKDEEERLESVLNDFRSTFEGGGRPISKTFIKTDIVNASSKSASTPSLYIPKPKNVLLESAQIQDPKQKAIELARKFTKDVVKSKSPLNRPPKLGNKVVQATKMSNLEIFKEELKQTQALRQERKGLRQQLVEKLGPNSDVIDRIAPALDNPYLVGSAEFDDDPTTTNLYISNMALEVTMDDLYDTFGTFGPLASAKILFPRPDEERRREHLCGFIAYMCRIDAERAWCAMSGERLKGSDMRVSWARPVVIPPVPFYVPIPLRELAMPDPPSGLPFNARPLSDDLRKFLKKYSNLPLLNSPLPSNEVEMITDYKKMIENSVIRVVIPTERPLLMLIHRVIEFLVREGPLFEAIIMAKERLNPMYRFLFENHHPTHVYYRWKLFSILQGEDRQTWRLNRFRMFDGGSWWEPPPHSLFDQGMPPQLYHTSYIPKRRGSAKYENQKQKSNNNKQLRASTETCEDDENERNDSKGKHKGVLSQKDREELENILRNLTPEKTCVGDAMVWCVEHSECAKEIAQCVYESLCIAETPLHKKIARIYLCSDILANCGARVRDVFYFRQYFSEFMLKIFVQLNATLDSIQSRIKAEQFRSRIMLCFRMWEDNSIYPTDILINMQNVFLGLAKPNLDNDDSDSEQNLDTDQINDDLDGIPMDIDGVPMDDEHESDNKFKTSSWSQVVDTRIETAYSSSKWDALEGGSGASKWESNDLNENFSSLSDKERKPEAEDLGDDSSPENAFNALVERSKTNNKEYEEERRKILRDIEVKVMKYQDELESDHCKNIDEEVIAYRKKQMSKIDEKIEKILSKKKSSKKEEKDSPKKSEGRKDSHRSSKNGDCDSGDRKSYHSDSRNRSSRTNEDLRRESSRHRSSRSDDRIKDRRHDRTPEKRRR